MRLTSWRLQAPSTLLSGFLILSNRPCQILRAATITAPGCKAGVTLQPMISAQQVFRYVQQPGIANTSRKQACKLAAIGPRWSWKYTTLHVKASLTSTPSSSQAALPTNAAETGCWTKRRLNACHSRDIIKISLQAGGRWVQGGQGPAQECSWL